MRRALRYLWNLLVVLAWTLLLVIGAVCGVDRQRLLRVLRPTRKTSRTSPAAVRLERAVPAEPVAPAGPVLVVGTTPDDVESALNNLGVAKPDAKRMVKAATAAGCTTFDEIFAHACESRKAS